MAVDEIQQEFRKKVCAQLSLRQEGIDRYNVVTPFVLDDGDHPAIVLRKEPRGWVLSDEGSTYMRLTYEIDEKDLLTGNRYRIIANTLSAFSVEDRDGELVLPIPDERFGDALFSFVQAVLRISDVTFISREVVRSTFTEDFRSLLESVVPTRRMEVNWHDPERDPTALYTVDYRLNERPKPVFIYSLPNDDKVRDATIALTRFENWGIRFEGLGVFEEQEDINRKALARFTDVCRTQFSRLAGNENKIRKYLEEVLSV